MQDSFKTIASSTQALYKEKGSKFLAFTYPVRNEEDIKEKLEALRKEYYDARHHCYAYILGAAREKFRANDDGEPNHSAGDPILGQIRSFGLTDTLVVVVRYFGGTKLGVGGLIQAYKEASQEALAQCQIIEKTIRKTYELRYEYGLTTEAQRLLGEFDLEIYHQEYSTDCLQVVGIKVSDTPRFEEKAASLYGWDWKATEE